MRTMQIKLKLDNSFVTHQAMYMQKNLLKPDSNQNLRTPMFLEVNIYFIK